MSNKKHVPDFKRSMKTAEALEAYGAFKALVAQAHGGTAKVKDGVFGAMMDVQLVNDGPVTLIIESPGGGVGGEEVGEQAAML